MTTPPPPLKKPAILAFLTCQFCVCLFSLAELFALTDVVEV
jgi:hypothetical protein